MKTRLVALGLALTVASVLLLGARTAAAEETVYLTLTGQKQGPIAGDAPNDAHLHQFVVHAFSASPAQVGASPVSVTMSISLYALPNLFAALTGKEPVQAIFATYAPATTNGVETKERTVTVQDAFVTALSLSTAPGSELVLSATLSTVRPLTCTEASGSACASPLPAVLFARPRHVGSTISAVIATARSGKVQPTVTGVQWQMDAAVGGLGRPMIGNVVLTTGAGDASKTLAAPAADGQSVAGTTITWTAQSGYVVKLNVLSGKLRNGGAADAFDVAFQAALAGSAMVQVTRTNPSVQAAY